MAKSAGSVVAMADLPSSRQSTQLIVTDGLCPRIGELLPGALHEQVALGLHHNPLTANGAALYKRRLQENSPRARYTSFPTAALAPSRSAGNGLIQPRSSPMRISWRNGALARLRS
jgi:hypothetical protein